MERNIDDIVSTLKAGKEANRRCSLLIGAGCSVKAGIPLANSFVDYIKQNHHAAYNHKELKAREWLELAKEKGTLPASEHLVNDTDLDNVRSCSWFQDFLG